MVRTMEVWATYILEELPDGIMYHHPFLHQALQLLAIEWLCTRSTINLLLGILTAILLRKSLGRQGSDKEHAGIMRCASSGIAEGDEIRLKKCDNFDLLRLCSDNCKEDQMSQHEKRAAELRDEVLFRQPESSHLGDCPICCLPFPLDHHKHITTDCCSKRACIGCAVATLTCRKLEDVQPTCPFCRHPMTTGEEVILNEMKRVEANDPVALCRMGARHYDKGDYDGAFNYSKRAAELGDAAAHNQLAGLYRKGLGVQKDEEKLLYHLEEASIRGHPLARHNLGVFEWINKHYDRAVKHWVIAANLGEDESLQELKGCYRRGFITKDCFAAALRGHYAAVAATKSSQREIGELKLA